MKQTGKTIICAVLAILGTACTKESQDSRSDENPEVRFRTNITLTKVNGTQWESRDRIGIFMTGSDGEPASILSSNRKYVPSSGNALVPESDGDRLCFPKDGSAADFFAYCPYTELSGTTAHIDLSDQSDQGAIDFVYASNTEGKSKNDPDVMLDFKHVLSALTLEVVLPEGADADGLSCTVYGMDTSADFDLAGGKLGERGGNRGIVPHRSGKTFEAILLPAVLDESDYIEFKSGQETYRWDISSDIRELVSGNRYIYTVSLSPEAAVEAGTTAGITDWACSNGQVSIGSKPETTFKVGDFYPDPEVQEGGYAEGIVFHVSADGKHGKMLSLKESSGLKWNTTGGKDETLEENDGALNWEKIRAKDATFADYPAFAWCASLGDGWYIPAINELIAIRSAWGGTIEEKEAFNKRISSVGGQPLKATATVGTAAKSAYYYSSTEKESAANKALSLSFNGTSGASDGIKKTSDSAENLIFRAIKKF